MVRFKFSSTALALGLLACDAFASNPDVKDRIDFTTALKSLTVQDKSRLSESLGVEAERFEVQHGKRLLFPEVNVSLNETWHKEATDTGANSPRADLAAEAKANLFAFGRDSARLDALHASSVSLDWKQTIINFDAERRAAELLLNEISLSFQKLVIEDAKVSRQTLRNRVRAYFESGRLPKDEVDRLDIDMNSLELEYEQVLNQKNQTDLKIQTRLNDALVVQAWPLEQLLHTSKDDPFIDLVTSIGQETRNPQLALQQSELDIRRARYNVTRKSLLPTLDLEARIESPVGRREGESHSGSVMLSLNYPLVGSQSSSHLTESSHRQVLAQEANVSHMAQNILESRKANSSELALELKQFRTRQDLLRRAIDMQRISRRGFETGLVKYSELSLDEQRVHQLKLDQIRSTEKIHLLVIDLCHSQGLPWTQCLGALDN